jgi:hypothetical protein
VRREWSRDRSPDWNLRAGWARQRERFQFHVGTDLLFRRDISGVNVVTRFDSIATEVPDAGSRDRYRSERGR